MAAADIVVTGCQVEPPSVETSTPATTPPPLSVAVPLIVTVLPFANVAPADGEVIVEVGGGGVGGLRGRRQVRIPACAGCAPMSASRLTVACCMIGLGRVLGVTVVVGVEAPRPLDRARVEDERTAGGPVQGQVLGRVARAKSSW